MKILVQRHRFGAEATVSRVDIVYDGDLEYSLSGWRARRGEPQALFFGAALEDQDRGLDAAMSLADIRARKVRAETAIPIGTYVVRRTRSPALGHLTRDGRMMGLVDVPAFVGIRIHPGRRESGTAGCVMIGLGALLRGPSAGWSLVRSESAWRWLDERVSEAEHRGERVECVISRQGWVGVPNRP